MSTPWGTWRITQTRWIHCILLGSPLSAVCISLPLEYFLLHLATGLHCTFTHVGMNNGSVRLGHRSHHRGPAPVSSIYMLSSPLLSITGSRHQWEAGLGLNQVSWFFADTNNVFRRQCNNYRKGRKSDGRYCAIPINWSWEQRRLWLEQTKTPGELSSCWGCWSP